LLHKTESKGGLEELVNLLKTSVNETFGERYYIPSKYSLFDIQEVDFF
jgi:hypothetical protein